MELSDLIKRAWQDTEFKRALLSDPRTTLEKALGVSLPAGLRIYIHEQTPTDLHLVLPMPPEELDAASGPNAA